MTELVRSENIVHTIAARNLYMSELGEGPWSTRIVASSLVALLSHESGSLFLQYSCCVQQSSCRQLLFTLLRKALLSS